MKNKASYPFLTYFLSLAALLSIGIALVARVFLNQQLAEAHAVTETTLASMAELMASGIANWIHERQGDATTIQENSAICNLLASPTDKQAREAAARCLNALCAAYGYEAVVVFDARGTHLLSTPNNQILQDACISGFVQAALHTNSCLRTEIHRSGPHAPLHLSLLSPIRQPGNTNAAADGVVLLRVNVDRLLFPLTQTWPTPGRSVETLLIRQEQDSLLCLNAPSNQTQTALEARQPLAPGHCSFAQTMSCVNSTMVSCVDYRGIRVLALSRAIPGTSWQIITKIDQDEVEAPLRIDAWHFVLIASMTTLSTLLLTILLWRQNTLHRARKELAARAATEQALRQSEARAQAMLAAIPDMIFRVNREGVFLDYRAEVSQLYVQDTNSIIGRRYRELMPASFSQLMGQQVHATLTSGTIVTFEYQLMLPGRSGPQDYEARLTPSGPDEITAIVRNVTQRKQMERFSAIQLELSKTLSSCQNLKEGLRLCLLAAFRTTGFDSGGFYLFNDHTAALDLIAHEGLTPEFASKAARFEAGSHHVHLVNQGTPVYLRLPEPKLPDADELHKEGLTFVAMIPIGQTGQMIGCMNLASHTVGELEAPARAHLEILADSARTAIARLKAEQALQESQQRLQMALDAAHMGVWEYDFITQKLFWSPEIFRHFNLGNREPSRELLMSMMHPEDLGVSQAAMDVALAEHGFYHAEYRVVVDNQIHWVEDRGQIIRDENGHPVKAIGTAQTVTEQRETEAERKRLAAAIEQAAELIVMTDLDGTIRYVNPAFEAVTGYARQDAIGKTPRLLKSGRHDRAFYERMWETLLGGNTWRGHLTNRRKDGTLYEGDAVISPVRNSSGEITNFVTAQRDVTREQLLERQVRQAQKMEAVGQLASGVAHDFNNLLQAILGFADLLLVDIPEGDRKRDDVLEIIRSGQRAASLTKQLLAFSRQEISKPTVVDLNTVIENAQKMLRRLLGEDIRITLELANTLPPIMADLGQIDQIIMNLCINARDAMPGGGRLTISTVCQLFDEASMVNLPEAQPGRYVCMAVSDTGTGMSPEVQARLFEPFFSTKGPGKGSGLGLAVIYGIVKQHSGWVNVYSKEGQGSTFKIYLPANALAVATDEEKPVAAQPGKGERILLIEDDPPIRNMAARVLGEAGYAVQSAGTSAEGIALFEREHGQFDLVVSDVVLPDQNGIATTEHLQQLNPHLAVVLCSGYTDERSRWRAIEEKKYIFLQKPYPLADLLKAARKALDG